MYKMIFTMLWATALMLGSMKPAASLAQTVSAETEKTGSLSPSTKWQWQEGQIVIESPQRPANQQHALGLTVPKMDVVRIAFVGLGMRGADAVARYTYIPGTHIMALCDYEEQRAEACEKYLRDKNLPPADIYSGEEGYKQLCERNDIDLVYIATDWLHHFPVAEYALQHGKNVAIEVPAAMNLEQIWTLINLSEQKRLHCMILENCCYDWYEMTALNMVQKGVLGEVLRAEGAYIHTLDDFWDIYWKDPNDKSALGWRMTYNMKNRGDLYPTHGLGPVAQALNIHRGDRFTTLVAMDTKSVHGKEYVEKKTGKPCSDFRNGDHTTTLMRTAQGKVVEIQHNVMNAQPYNRLYKLVGTKGYATKYPVEHYALSSKSMTEAGIPDNDNMSGHEFLPAEKQKALEEKYEHPILKKYGAMAKDVGGHGGMDFIMDSRLVYCLQNGLPLDMDVYDLAEWCCLAELGALSMDHNSASVAVPDFTRGHWQDKSKFTHAFASPEQEKITESKAKAETLKLQEMTIKKKLWQKYDKKK